MTGRYLGLTGTAGRNFGIEMDAMTAAPFAPQNAAHYSYLPTVPNDIDPQTFLRDMFALQPRRMVIGRIMDSSSGADIGDALPTGESDPQMHGALLDLYGRAYEIASTPADTEVKRAVQEASKRVRDRETISRGSMRAVRLKGLLAVAGFAMYETSPQQYEGILAVSSGVVKASKEVLTRRGIVYKPEMYWPLAVAIMTPKRRLEAELERFKSGQIIKPNRTIE
jgi:hypothetical protein